MLSLSKEDPARKALAVSAAKHADAGLAHVASGDYAGERFVEVFACLETGVPASIVTGLHEHQKQTPRRECIGEGREVRR